jgi:Na+/proline symporter
MATRAFAGSVRVFATSIPLALLLGPILPAHWLAPVTILTLSACSVVYTYFGGTRAVVWTDVVQMTTYLLGGVAALVLLGMGVDGGWSAILSRAAGEHKLMLIDTSFVLNNPHTLWAGLFGGAFLSMASHGADQLIVQRLLGARNLADARRALFTDAVVVILQFGLFLMVGIGLWAYYHGQAFAQSDSIFPQFIVTVMPHGLRGLIVAALTAAAMGTISSSLNSLAAATTHDLWMPISKHRAEDPETLRAARRFTLIWAVVLIGGALLYREQGTPVVVIALAIASFTYGPLLGGFFLGIFWKAARQRDVILGMSVAVVVMSAVVFAKQLGTWVPSLAAPLAPYARIAWPWYVLMGTSITLFFGILSSFIPTSRTAPASS